MEQSHSYYQCQGYSQHLGKEMRRFHLFQHRGRPLIPSVNILHEGDESYDDMHVVEVPLYMEVHPCLPGGSG